MLLLCFVRIMDDIGGGAREMGSGVASTPWQPIQLVFKRYFPHNGSDIRPQTLRATVKKKAVSSTLSLSLCNSENA